MCVWKLLILAYLCTRCSGRTVNQQIISCVAKNSTISPNTPVVCSCYFECEEVGTCVPKGLCDCSDWLLRDEYVCQEHFVELNYLVTRCFGIESNSTRVCSGHGTCVFNDECECNWGWLGEKCDEESVSSLIISAVYTNIWFLFLAFLSLLFVGALLFTFCVAKLRKREMKKDLGLISDRYEQLEELYVTFYFLDELCAKLKLVSSIRENLNDFEKILKTKVIDVYQEKKCWRLILKIFDELIEENEHLTDQIEPEKLYFQKKSNEKLKLVKFIQKKRFEEYSRILFSQMRNSKMLNRNVIIEQIDTQRVLKKVKDKLVLVKEDDSWIRNKESEMKKKTEVSLSRGKEEGYSKEEMEIIKRQVQMYIGKGEQRAVLYKMKNSEREGSESIVNIELDKKVDKLSEIDFRKIKYNAKNKYRTLKKQRGEYIQTVCEELILKIRKSIDTNNDIECEYFCSSLFNKIIVHYFDISSALKVLKQLMDIMQVILDNNESNVEKVVLNVLNLVHYFVQIAYFNQKKDNIKMNMEQKQRISNIVVQFNDKYSFNFQVQFTCFLIKECLLIISDTSVFATKFFNSLNLLKPSLILFLIREQFLTFQTGLNAISTKPFYIELLRMELKYQLHPIDFRDFLDLNFKNYYLRMFKIDILYRICIDHLNMDILLDNLPELIPGKRMKYLLPSTSILGLEGKEKSSKKVTIKKEMEGKRKEKKDVEQKDSPLKEEKNGSEIITEEVIVIEEKKKEKKGFYSDVYIKFKLVNFLLCWNKIQEFTKPKVKNVKIISKAIEKTHKIATKAETALDWTYLKGIFRKNKKITSLIKKLEVTQNKFYLFERYLNRIICEEKFLELRLPIVKEQYTTFNGGKTIDWLYDTISQEKYIILEGLGGSGKSCLAKHLAFRLFYGKNLYSFFIRGPLIARYYKQWRTSQTSVELKVEILIDTIIESFDSNFSELFSSIELIELKIQLKQILCRQKVVLMIDAFDEVSVVERNMFVNLLKVLVFEEEVKIEKILLTSRPSILIQYGKSVNMFKRIVIDPLTHGNSEKLVNAILRYNKRDDDEEVRVMKRFGRLLEVKGKESNFPLISVLLLRRILNTEEKDDIQIMNNNFVLYSSLIFGSVLHDVKKYKNRINSVANASIYWILNLLSIVGYLNSRIPNANRDKIIHILNKDLEDVIDSEQWIMSIPNPIYTIMKSLIHVCGILCVNKNFIIFSHRTIQEYAASRFLINPDNNKSLARLRKKYNQRNDLYFSFWFKDPSWTNIYKFYFQYFDPKITGLKSNFEVMPRMGRRAITTTDKYIYVLNNILCLSEEVIHRGIETNAIFANVLEKIRMDLAGVYGFTNKLKKESLVCYFGNSFSNLESLVKYKEGERVVKVFPFHNDNELILIKTYKSIRSNVLLVNVTNKKIKNLLELDRGSFNSMYSISNKKRKLMLLNDKLYDLNNGMKVIHKFETSHYKCTVTGDSLLLYEGWKNSKYISSFNLSSLKFEVDKKIVLPFVPDKLQILDDSNMVLISYGKVGIVHITEKDENNINKHVVLLVPKIGRNKKTWFCEEKKKFVMTFENAIYLCELVNNRTKLVASRSNRIPDYEIVYVTFVKGFIIAASSNSSLNIFNFEMNLIKVMNFNLNEIGRSFRGGPRNRIIWNQIVRSGLGVINSLSSKYGILFDHVSKSLCRFPINFTPSKRIDNINSQTTHVFSTFSGIDFNDVSNITMPFLMDNFAMDFNDDNGKGILFNFESGDVKYFEFNKKGKSIKVKNENKFNIGTRLDSLQRDNFKVKYLSKGSFVIFNGLHLYCYDEKGFEVKDLNIFSFKSNVQFRRNPACLIEVDGLLFIGYVNSICVINIETFSKVFCWVDDKTIGAVSSLRVFCEELFLITMSGSFYKVSYDKEKSKIEFERFLPKEQRIWTHIYSFSYNEIIFRLYGKHNNVSILNLETKEIRELTIHDLDELNDFFYIKNSPFIIHMNRREKTLGMFDIYSGKVVYWFDKKKFKIPFKFKSFFNDELLFIFENVKDKYLSEHFEFQMFKVMSFDMHLFTRAFMFRKTVLYMRSKEEMENEITKITEERKIKMEDFQMEVVKFLREKKKNMIKRANRKLKIVSE